MAYVTRTIEAPLGRGGDMRQFDIRVDEQTGEPDTRRVTPRGLAAWDWHKRHREQTNEPR